MRTSWVLVTIAVGIVGSGPCLAVDHSAAVVAAGIHCVRAAIRYHGGEILYDSTRDLSITGTVDGKPPDAAAVARLTAMAERVQAVITRLADCSALRDPSDWPWVLFSGGKLEGNAFCYVAGAIGVSAGIVTETAGDDGYLAFCLAHEMSHYINGDQGKDPEGPLNEDEVLAQLRAATPQPRPRDEVLNSERMADMGAISLMHQAGYDPMAALRLTDDKLRELGALACAPVAGVPFAGAPLAIGILAIGELVDDHGFLVQRRIWLAEGVRLALDHPQTGEAKPWERQGTRVGEEIAGPDGGTYVWVPPGEFMMGSENGDDDEKPVHRVRITKGYWLSKCEVTNAQYLRFVEATGHRAPNQSVYRDPPVWRNGSYPSEMAEHPVVCVSWEDAKAYCDYYGLRLPTEAEWEYSARGPKASVYPWGNEWDKTKCCHYENRGPKGRTFPVGSFPAGASWCGALGLAGNVEEWCWDWYGAGYYSASPGSDPEGSQGGRFRAYRGGCWGSSSNRCRAALRGGQAPEVGTPGSGFRPAVLLR